MSKLDELRAFKAGVLDMIEQAKRNPKHVGIMRETGRASTVININVPVSLCSWKYETSAYVLPDAMIKELIEK